MACYSVQPRDQIFVKGHWFLYFAKNMGRNIDKNISKNLSSKYSQRLIVYAKISATDALKTASKRAIQKTAETTGDLIGNKIADKITIASKTPPTISEANKEEILGERFIPPELRRESIDDLSLKEENYWWSKITIII